MNQIAHQHHTLDPAEGPDLDVEDIPSVIDDEDDGPVVGSDAVASSDGEEPFD
ncbi:hypothetical protein GCM10022286_25070 [Gryllotalpicola daejeonensis]|uniref:Uncharacterized protein n=1 Tax=Gryllotalpicola daejeonensis TaxID=993087 RepID=A0ABP7ZM42_9MICO